MIIPRCPEFMCSEFWEKVIREKIRIYVLLYNIYTYRTNSGHLGISVSKSLKCKGNKSAQTPKKGLGMSGHLGISAPKSLKCKEKPPDQKRLHAATRSLK